MSKLYKKIIVFYLLLVSCNNQGVNELRKDFYSDSSSNIKEEYYLDKGRYNGIYRAFYMNGNIQTLGVFKLNIKFGNWYYYYPNGRIQTIHKLNESGETISLNFWDKFGKRNIIEGTGSAILYFSNGKIMSIMSYKNNVLHGKCQTWYNNGKIASESFFNNGKSSGTWSFWNEEGALVRSENY